MFHFHMSSTYLVLECDEFSIFSDATFAEIYDYNVYLHDELFTLNTLQTMFVNSNTPLSMIDLWIITILVS